MHAGLDSIGKMKHSVVIVMILVSVALMELKRDVLRIINIIINFFLDAKHQKYYKLMLP